MNKRRTLPITKKPGPAETLDVQVADTVGRDPVGPVLRFVQAVERLRREKPHLFADLDSKSPDK